MMVKAALLFLLAMLVLGLFGRWSRKTPPRDKVELARKCPDCGAYVLGTTPEPCARPGCPIR
jgi:hypothetical protein